MQRDGRARGRAGGGGGQEAGQGGQGRGEGGRAAKGVPARADRTAHDAAGIAAGVHERVACTNGLRASRAMAGPHQLGRRGGGVLGARTHRRKPGDRLAEVIRVDRLISREHVSAVAVAAAVHQGRVRVPCASSATLGNSTERVNGGLELHTHEFERPFLGPGSRSIRLSFWGGVGNAAKLQTQKNKRLDTRGFGGYLREVRQGVRGNHPLQEKDA